MNKKSATQVIQEALFASLCDAIMAFRDGSGGIPNVLLRELTAVNVNATMDTLPEGVQRAIRASAHNMFNRLAREGYSITGDISPPRKKSSK
jgi:hypothetical protein